LRRFSDLGFLIGVVLVLDLIEVGEFRQISAYEHHGLNFCFLALFKKLSWVRTSKVILFKAIDRRMKGEILNY
jgi:hypothetical protein